MVNVEVKKVDFENVFKNGKLYGTTSDVGEVRIGNDKFTYGIRNGYGDGHVNVWVIDYPDHTAFINTHFECAGTINGEFNIYSHDCGEKEVVATVPQGKYYVEVLNFRMSTDRNFRCPTVVFHNVGRD